MKVNQGDPIENGPYVVYVENKYGLTYASRKFLVWISGAWWHPSSDRMYRGKIYGWIGPLPRFVIVYADDGEE